MCRCLSFPRRTLECVAEVLHAVRGTPEAYRDHLQQATLLSNSINYEVLTEQRLIRESAHSGKCCVVRVKQSTGALSEAVSK
jgi:hypothetical protein